MFRGIFAGRGPVPGLVTERGEGWESFTPIDAGYLDWRFLQDTAACVNGIVKGQWLTEGSRLRFVEKPAGARSNPAWGTGKRGDMVFGMGSLMISLETAYDAAGLKMPQ